MTGSWVALPGRPWGLQVEGTTGLLPEMGAKPVVPFSVRGRCETSGRARKIRRSRAFARPMAPRIGMPRKAIMSAIPPSTRLTTSSAQVVGGLAAIWGPPRTGMTTSTGRPPWSAARPSDILRQDKRGFSCDEPLRSLPSPVCSWLLPPLISGLFVPPGASRPPRMVSARSDIAARRWWPMSAFRRCSRW
jgi:hypothetical protein